MEDDLLSKIPVRYDPPFSGELFSFALGICERNCTRSRLTLYGNSACSVSSKGLGSSMPCLKERPVSPQAESRANPGDLYAW